MTEDISTVTQSSDKLRKLEDIASGTAVSLDSSSLKTKIATFIVAHADKVMDTVAPLETLREELTGTYIEKVMERIDDPEVSPGLIAGMIYDIQRMNRYSIQTLSDVLDREQLQPLISIDASDNSQTQVNVLNLESAPSRAKVAKAVAALTALMQQSQDEGDNNNDN